MSFCLRSRFPFKQIWTVLAVCASVSGLWGAPVALAASDSDGSNKYFELARRAMNAKDYQAAEDILSIGITKYPASGKLWYHRATVRSDFLRRTEDAVSDYTRVIKLKDEYCLECSKANCYRGWALYRMGEYELAIRDFDRSLVVMPIYKKVYLYRAKAYGKLGKVAEATRDCELYKQAFPGSAGLADAVVQKLREGRTDFD